MMMVPRMFGESLFDDFFPVFDDEFYRHGRSPLYGKHEKNLMKTDVRETDSSYELMIDLPGFKKEDVNAKLEDGYLTISAAKGLDKDEKDKDGKYIRRERYSGSMSRSFYIGEQVHREDIHAKFANGILTLTIPKQQPQLQEQNRFIAIEGE